MRHCMVIFNRKLVKYYKSGVFIYDGLTSFTIYIIHEEVSPGLPIDHNWKTLRHKTRL